MQFPIQCSQCQNKYAINTSEYRTGSSLPCPHCNTEITVPKIKIIPGVTLGGFTVERKLGEGAMGQVFLATQESMGRQVALKVLHPQMTTSKDATLRFQQEVRMAAKVEHPNLVSAYQAGEDSGIHFLAIRYIDGVTVQQRIDQQGKLNEQAALTITRKVADALQLAWNQHQLLHRDIKPENIMLEKDGEPQLMDLGLAKSLNEGSGLTQTSMAMGTPNYMSPEQIDSAANIDCRSDIYSLGASLYHMVTGSAPFSGGTITAVLMKQMTEPLADPRNFAPDLSQGCLDLIEGMTCKDKALRYQRYEDVIQDLNRVLRKEHLAHPSRPQNLKPELNETLPEQNAGLGLPLKILGLTLTVLMIIAGSYWAYTTTRGTSKDLPASKEKNQLGLEVAQPVSPPSPSTTVAPPPPSKVSKVEPPAVEKPPKAEKSEKPTPLEDLENPSELITPMLDALILGDYPFANNEWQHLKKSPALMEHSDWKPIQSTIDKALNLEEHILAHFEALKNTEIDVHLKEGVKSLQIVGRKGKIIQAEVLLKVGNRTVGSTPKSFDVEDLSIQEKIRSIGQSNDAESDTLKGLLLLGNNKPEAAMAYFKRADSWLSNLIFHRAQHYRELSAKENKARTLKIEEAKKQKQEILAVQKYTQLLSLLDLNPKEMDQATLLKSLYDSTHSAATLTQVNALLRNFESTATSSEVYKSNKAILSVIARLKPEQALPFSKERLDRAIEYLNEANGGNANVSHMNIKDNKVELVIGGTETLNDISPLAGLPIRKITIYKSALTDISVLEGMPLEHFHIGLSRTLEDISPLADLPLKHVSLQQTSITDIQALKELSLDSLEIFSAGSTIDISPLQGSSLKKLHFDRFKVQSFNPLKDLPLSHLELTNTGIDNLDFVKTLPLKTLKLSNNPIKDLSPLDGLTLEHLDISRTQISNIEVLKNLNLKTLEISGMKGLDLSPLKGMPLNKFMANSTQNLDLSPLLDSPLTRVEVKGTEGVNIEILQKIPTLKQADVIQ